MVRGLRPKNPLRLTFHISSACNLRCTYCYQKVKNTKVLSFDNAKKFIDEIIKMKLGMTSKLECYFVDKDRVFNQGVELDFLGGESTLFIGLIEQITDYFFKCVIENKLTDWLIDSVVTVETNGTTYFDKTVNNFFVKYKHKLQLPITIDGCRECHDQCRVYPDGRGSYDNVIDSIKASVELLGEYPNTKLTFCKENMKYIKQSIENMVNLGYKKFRASFNISSQLTEEDSDQYYNCLKEAADYIIDNNVDVTFTPFFAKFNQDLSRGNCGLFGDQMCIDWNGDLYNCFRFCESSLGDKKHPIGNVNNGITDKEFIKQYINSETEWEDTCKNCPISKGCEECPADNYFINGCVNKPVRNCGVTVAEARAQRYFIDRAKRSDYKYKDDLDKIDANNMYDPSYQYKLFKI